MEKDFGNAYIDEKIKYAESFLEKYEFPTEQKKLINSALENIKKRQDKAMRIAVMGEKSNFINSLLGEELFDADETKTVSVILYGEKMSVTMYGKSGNTMVYSFKNIEMMKELISSFTKGERPDTVKIILKYPSDFLKKGICIYIAPEINSNEYRCVELAKKVLCDEVDGCIVLMNEDKRSMAAVSSFLEENFSKDLENCIFIDTKKDFALPEYLNEQKDKMKFNRSISVLDYIFVRIEENTKKIMGLQKELHEKLYEEKINTPREFVNIKKLSYNNIFTKVREEEKAEIKEKLNKISKAEQKRICSKLCDCTNKLQADKFLKGLFEKMLNESSLKMKNAINTKNADEVSKKIIKDFEQSFREEYSLEKETAFNAIEVETMPAPINVKLGAGDVMRIRDKVNNSVKNKYKLFFNFSIIKGKMRASLEEALGQYFDRTRENIISDYERYTDAIWENIENVIYRYIGIFSLSIEEMQMKNIETRKKAVAVIGSLERDIPEIRRAIEELRSLKSKNK